MRPAEHGISLIEILVALTILSVGLLGLVGASAMVSRMLGQGRWSTVTMGYAQQRHDLMRSAARDSTGCASLGGGTASLPGGLTEQWTVSPGMRSVAVEVVLSGPLSQADTLATVIQCQ
jgi:prepilin-type N-terminal cleavage/methylation domain-containing protein